MWLKTASGPLQNSQPPTPRTINRTRYVEWRPAEGRFKGYRFSHVPGLEAYDAPGGSGGEAGGGAGAGGGGEGERGRRSSAAHCGALAGALRAEFPGWGDGHGYGEVELRAGDLFYLPRGWFHEVDTDCEGPGRGAGRVSLAVNHWFDPASVARPQGGKEEPPPPRRSTRRG